MYPLSLAFTKARSGQLQVPTDSDRGGNSQQELLGMLCRGKQILALNPWTSLWLLCEAQLLFLWKKIPNHLHISSSCPLGLLKATPKATVSHTWKESPGCRPTKHPPQNPFLFVLHLFAVSNHPNHGRPWLSSLRKAQCPQEPLLLVTLPEEAQPRAEFSEHSGNHREPSQQGSGCIYTEAPAASVGFSLFFSPFSLWQSLCVWEEHRAALCISLVLPLLAASVRPPSPELAVSRSNKHSCSSPAMEPAVQVGAHGFEVEV